MNVVDSSGWLEYFSGASNAGFFSPAIADTRSLIVPTVIVFEVVKRVLSCEGESAAAKALSFMGKGRIVDIDETIAVMAARIGLRHGLPMADSIILATARAFGAILWTQDEDFEGIDGVRYVKRSS